MITEFVIAYWKKKGFKPLMVGLLFWGITFSVITGHPIWIYGCIGIGLFYWFLAWIFRNNK